MKTPAEKCAERIVKIREGTPDATKAKLIRIIQSEYAPTIQVAREAMEASVDLIVALQNKPLVKCSKEWGDAIDKLRFALDRIPKL